MHCVSSDEEEVEANRQVKHGDTVVEEILVELSDLLVRQHHEADQLGCGFVLLEIEVHNPADEVECGGVHSPVNHLHDVLSLLCFEVEQVDGHVVVQVPDWVEALALNAADVQVVCLPGEELAGLSHVSSVVRAEPVEWHEQVRNVQYKVEAAHQLQHRTLAQFEAHHVNEQAYVQDHRANVSKQVKRLCREPVVRVSEEAAIEVHHSIKVIVVLKVPIHHCTAVVVHLRMHLLAPVTIGMVCCQEMNKGSKVVQVKLTIRPPSLVIPPGMATH